MIPSHPTSQGLAPAPFNMTPQSSTPTQQNTDTIETAAGTGLPTSDDTSLQGGHQLRRMTGVQIPARSVEPTQVSPTQATAEEVMSPPVSSQEVMEPHPHPLRSHPPTAHRESDSSLKVRATDILVHSRLTLLNGLEEYLSSRAQPPTTNNDRLCVSIYSALTNRIYPSGHLIQQVDSVGRRQDTDILLNGARLRTALAAGDAEGRRTQRARVGERGRTVESVPFETVRASMQSNVEIAWAQEKKRMMESEARLGEYQGEGASEPFVDPSDDEVDSIDEYAEEIVAHLDLDLEDDIEDELYINQAERPRGRLVHHGSSDLRDEEENDADDEDEKADRLPKRVRWQ